MKDEIGIRFKEYYENIWKIKLPRRMPMIIRLDGKAFHTLTRHMEKPFDKNFINCMILAGKELLNNIAGSKFAYIQSDEISILVHDYTRLNTCAWFDKEIQKICSVSASIASVTFTKHLGKCGYFDARCFVLPENEVNNYFIWRQKDCSRNSINAMGQSIFSHKQLNGKSCKKVVEMLFENNTPWEKLAPHLKNGIGIVDNEVIENLPIFSQSPQFVNHFLKTEIME